MDFFILDNAEHKHGYHKLKLGKTWPEALPSRLFDGPGDGGALLVEAVSYGGGRKKPWHALATVRHVGALVLHRDALARLKKLKLRSEPIPFVPAKGKKPVEGYELVRIDAHVPLDRLASALEVDDEASPLVGVVRRVKNLRFSAGALLPPLFRLVDAPHLIVARADVLAQLAEATEGDLRARPYDPEEDLGFPPDDLPSEALDVEEKPARAAYEAFWRLLGGAAKPGDRSAALAHPVLAAGVALTVDRKPGDETREAASRSPLWAAMYAVHVDRAPRDDTRAAARRDPYAAYFYASEVDLAGDEALVKAMSAKLDWWRKEDIKGYVESLAKRRQEFRGDSAGPKEVATRELPRTKAVPPFRSKAEPARKIGPLSDELRADVAEMTARGYTTLGLAPMTPVPDVIDALHATLGAIQAGERKLPRGKAAGTERLALACVLADALHRGLGWQWATVGDAGHAAVVSPTGTHGVVPLTPIARLAVKGRTSNTLALMFNMLVAGSVPPAQPRAVVLIS